MLRNFRAVFKSNQTPMTVIMLVVLVGMVAYLAPTGGREGAPDNVMALIGDFTEKPTIGVLGEPRVNTLRLNLALDQRFPVKH